MNPGKSLIKSRKFWLLMLDMGVVLLTFFIGKYAEFALEDTLILIGAMQPVFVFVIGGIAFEDGMAKLNGTFPPR
jgi:hypothetical protein